VEEYTPEQKRILHFRPGITSAASLAYRHEEEILSGPDWEKEYRTKILPGKLTIDLAYLSHRTFWSDLILILRSVLSIFR
jgi:lipopolysaccharide/colanic/teichoic acid biosynthesis glycosyltransferase